MAKAIILCGFMGCGKSAVGRELAKQLGRSFVDMDSCIEDKAGMSVSNIFSKLGEPKFREMEREVCKELAQRCSGVIASGGGALTFDENVETFRQAECPIVLIDTPLDVILTRLEGDRSRPLLSGENREERAKQLYEKRIPIYRAAATLTVNGDASPRQVAERIAVSLGRHGR